MRSKLHYHRDGLSPYMMACWHVCQTKWKSFLFGWLIANTMTFPLEHLLWERIPPFNMITRMLGL